MTSSPELLTMMSRMMEYLDKILHVSSLHYDDYCKRNSRPYYPLNDNWGLTCLDTGALFFVNTEDRNVTPWILMGGHWEVNVGSVLMAYAQPGMVILDIGAHLGYYSVKLGHKIGTTGRLLAFEPNPEVNTMCEENLKINGLLSHVTLHKFALGNIEATATLTHSKSNMASANLLGDQDPDFTTEVRVRRLDDVVDPSLSVDLIKLDAEGYEKWILDGARAVLERSPQCAIMIELGLGRWERHASLADLVPACGGGGREIYAVHADGTLERFEIDSVRQFLIQCSYNENYFLVARPADVEARVGHLIRR